VWADRAVTDDSITQCLMEIRAAISSRTMAYALVVWVHKELIAGTIISYFVLMIKTFSIIREAQIERTAGKY
jgi:hypothetical protein